MLPLKSCNQFSTPSSASKTLELKNLVWWSFILVEWYQYYVILHPAAAHTLVNDKMKPEQFQRLFLRVISPPLDNYEYRLAALQVSELNVHLELCCLRFLERLKGKEAHPLPSIELKLRENINLHHSKIISKPETRTALMDKNLFYKF